MTVTFQKLTGFKIDVLQYKCPRQTSKFYTLPDLTCKGRNVTFKRETVPAYLASGYEKENVIKLVVCRDWEYGKAQEYHWQVAEYFTGVNVLGIEAHTREEALQRTLDVLNTQDDDSIKHFVEKTRKYREKKEIPLNRKSDLPEENSV